MTTKPKAEFLRPTVEPADFGTRELIAVREIAHAFHTAKRPEEVFQLALDKVSPLVGASFACVYAIDEGSEVMHLAAVHNWPQRYAKFLHQIRVRVGFGPSGAAASERRVVEVLDLFADHTLEDWRDVAIELGFRSLVAVPLQSGATVLGTVTFYFASSNAVTSESRHLMRIVADQMAASAEKARLIEDLRRANAALTDSNAKLERQNAELIEARRTKDEFLSNISHELRTPLTAVIGYISLMQEGLAGPVSEGQLVTLGAVKESSEHLLSLISDLLDLTALSRGGVEPYVKEIDPRMPLREAAARAKGRRTGVEFDVVMPDVLPSMRSDPGAIARVLRALLDNAFKFTQRGRVQASVTVADDRVIYAIDDTGIGIETESQSIVFDEFRQLNTGMTREYGGAGLGLALARRLAQLVQGDVSVTSTPGVGSTFRLELPLTYSPE
ncbi:MAG TPA: HAMP domain-containing sensor histidine kinase [Gemmatimonadaceae bacterium]